MQFINIYGYFAFMFYIAIATSSNIVKYNKSSYVKFLIVYCVCIKVRGSYKIFAISL